MAFTPNYQGLFLRGAGSRMFNSGGYGNVAHTAGGLGVVQGDAIRNIVGNIRPKSAGFTNSINGVFRPTSSSHASVGNAGGYGEDAIHFNAAHVVPTAVENRPINMAVRYLIRAQ